MSSTSSKRIELHPILEKLKKTKINFKWNGLELKGLKDETISSALIANGISIFGHHHKDGSPQGMFCANGQCSQCMVLVNKIAVKACMTKIKKDMNIESLEGLSNIHETSRKSNITFNKVKKYEIEVLIIGGGPAGLSAAIQLGKDKINTIIIDDKDSLGGKLILQTHKFFGSVEDSFAGIRGYNIAKLLEKKLEKLNSVKVWLNSTAIGIFSDGVIGILKDEEYKEIKYQKLLIATGAREKMISFPGNTLPGIYGAGAFQTLINRDLVRPSNKILIVGGGNVGLITAYHALQAGIEVVALIEALNKIGGYKVHSDKIIRMGIPILTKHTIVSAHGKNKIENVIIAELDSNYQIKPNSHKKYNVDTILIAVGLNKVDEFYLKAKQWDMDVYSAGDAQEIAEASSAMFSGKIEGLKILIDLKKNKEKIPLNWYKKAKILKSKPVTIKENIRKFNQIEKENENAGFVPILHCSQEIPCNPCTSVCPEDVIRTIENKITGIPYLLEPSKCKGCMACVSICPGLAITLIDSRKNTEKPTVTIPCEVKTNELKKGSKIPITDSKGSIINYYKIKRIINNKKFPKTSLIQVEIEKKFAKKALGIKFQNKEHEYITLSKKVPQSKEAMICRCERVSINKVKNLIRKGVTDLNQIKALTRLGMGACGSKTCHPLIWQILKEEKIKFDKVTDITNRPLFIEVPIGILAGKKEE